MKKKLVCLFAILQMVLCLVGCEVDTSTTTNKTTTSNKTTTTKTTTTSTSSPKTADTSNLLLWIVVFAAGICGVVFQTVSRRKRSR